MICNNCGGTFEHSAVKCPYCGSIHLAGATAAYNQKFEDMTDDIAALGDDHLDEYKKTLHKQGKHTLIYLGIAILVVGGFLCGLFAVWQAEKLAATENATEIKARLAWQTENYPLLDALYEAGDFDAILDFENALYTDGITEYTLYYWSHYNFIDLYRTYRDNCLAAQEAYTEGQTLDYYDYAWMLYFYLDNTAVEYPDIYTETELAYLAEYIANVALFLEESLGLSEADMLALYPSLLDENGWLFFSSCRDYMETFLAEG